MCTLKDRERLQATTYRRSPYFTIADAPESKSRRFPGVVYGLWLPSPLSFGREVRKVKILCILFLLVGYSNTSGFVIGVLRTSDLPPKKGLYFLIIVL